VRAPPAGPRRLVKGFCAPERRVASRRRRIAAHGEGTFDRLDAISATEASDKSVGERRFCEIKSNRVADDAGEPGGRCCPTFATAGLVEPGMHDLKLPAEAFRWHRDPHTNRKSLLCPALHPH